MTVRGCPKCGMPAPVLQPAEPDVGLLQDLFACAEHGGFFFDEHGVVGWVDIGARVPLPASAGEKASSTLCRHGYPPERNCLICVSEQEAKVASSETGPSERGRELEARMAHIARMLRGVTAPCLQCGDSLQKCSASACCTGCNHALADREHLEQGARYAAHELTGKRLTQRQADWLDAENGRQEKRNG